MKAYVFKSMIGDKEFDVYLFPYKFAVAKRLGGTEANFCFISDKDDLDTLLSHAAYIRAGHLTRDIRTQEFPDARILELEEAIVEGDTENKQRLYVNLFLKDEV